MANVRSLALIACLGLAGCSSPTGSSALLAGSWRTVAIPSGSGIDLSLTTSGPQVVGTGHEYALQYLAETLKVRGRRNVDRCRPKPAFTQLLSPGPIGPCRSQ